MVSTHTSLLVRLHSPEDSVAWNRFVKLYSPLLYLWVTRLGIEPAHRFDVCQEVLVTLINCGSWLETNRPQSFRAWLFTVTANKCRDQQRKLRRHTTTQTTQELDCELRNPIDELPTYPADTNIQDILQRD